MTKILKKIPVKDKTSVKTQAWSRSYIKLFVWYNLYNSQSVFKFSLRMQVVHIEFKTNVLTEYSVFKNSSKMIQEQATAALIIALISEKNKSKEKGK